MTKIDQEIKTVEFMIRLYCKKKEGNANLCENCKELLEFSIERLQHCKFGEQKTSCKKCPVHCYKPQMRERIRIIMRWSGPRMIFYHPIAAIKHLIG